MPSYNTLKNYFESVLCNYPTEKSIVTPNVENIRVIDVYEYENYIGFDSVSTSSQGCCKHCKQVITRIKDYRIGCTTIAR